MIVCLVQISSTIVNAKSAKLLPDSPYAENVARLCINALTIEIYRREGIDAFGQYRIVELDIQRSREDIVAELAVFVLPHIVSGTDLRSQPQSA